MRCFFRVTLSILFCCFLSEAYSQSSLSPLLRKADSCAYFCNYQASDSIYHHALSMADSLEDRSGYQLVLNCLINLYTRRQMYEKAFCYLRDFRERSRNKDDRAYVLLAKGNIWKDALEYDSAYHYYSLASQSTHPFIATNAYQQLSKLSALSGRYKQAFSSLQNYDELLTSAAMSLHREEMTDKYKEEKYKNELNEIRLAKKTRELFIVLLLAFVFFILAGAYVFYLRSKNLKLQHSKEVSLLREKESSLREALFRKMSVSQKIPSLDAGDESETIDKRIALSSADWAEIVQIVNDSYDHFAERLKAHYPLLTEKDIRFCCLIKINVTLKDLSDIYCISKSAITKKKFRLKKEKIGFKDSDQSLDDFLRTF